MLLTLVDHRSCGLVLHVLNLRLEQCNWGRGSSLEFSPFLLIWNILWISFLGVYSDRLNVPLLAYNYTVIPEFMCQDQLDPMLLLSTLLEWFGWMHIYFELECLVWTLVMECIVLFVHFHRFVVRPLFMHLHIYLSCWNIIYSVV